MAASRLPLWHRLLVIFLILGVSGAILVWGYVLNVGTLVVHLDPGDVLRVDSDALPPDGAVRAGKRHVQVQRLHHAAYEEDVVVPRGKVVEVTPVLEFIPYMLDTARSSDTPLLTVSQQAQTYREQPGSLASYPTTTLRLQKLEPTDKVTSLVAAPDWNRMWVALEDGREMVRTPAGDVFWTGSSIGRAFAGSRFVFATRAEGGVTLQRLEVDGSTTTIGALEGEGTFTLIPSPDGQRLLAIDDAKGGGTLVSDAGRERLELDHVALDGRWSPDGTHVLLQVRMEGAAAGSRLALYDIVARREDLLELRSTVALTTFSDDGSRLYALERQSTSSITQEELNRQLSDPRVQELVDQVQEEVLQFVDFQDAIPSDLGVAASLVEVNVQTKERRGITVDGLKLTSETHRLERGDTPETLLIQGPDAIRTVILKDTGSAPSS